ncbi:MAG: sulfite exporter TauE/SafE family protein [bacterium]|nr:sulfite exporter TauE/SafE family protein [bacterium]
MRSEVFSEKVDGMICPQCEDEIAQKITHRRGVLSCRASYRKSSVTAQYDPDIITPGEIKSALSDIGYPVGSGKSGLISDMIGAACVIVLYFALPWLTGLVKVPQAEAGAGAGVLFVIGLLTGVHCIGMCGGIMLTQKNAVAYNAGRLLSYTALGALFGALGTVITYDAQFKSMLFTICGGLVVIVGLMMWGVPFLVIGLLTGLMPCGALASMWLFTAASGSALKGAESMFAFGLGTCAVMLLFGTFGTLIPAKYNKYILKSGTVLIVTLGLILMTKGIAMI